jgi:CspA family cold shock protein
MASGKVKWFDAKKGYGFLVSNEGGDVFVHYAHITGEGFRSLEEGQSVEFDVEATPKGPQARNVRPVAAA